MDIILLLFYIFEGILFLIFLVYLYWVIMNIFKTSNRFVRWSNENFGLWI